MKFPQHQMKFLVAHLPKNLMELTLKRTRRFSAKEMQQNSSYSIKRNEDCIHAEAILKSPLFSASEEFIHVKIGLRVMKENSPNKAIVSHLNINSLRNKF